MQEKQCTKCDKVKPIEMFRKKHAHRDGYAPECKTCARELDVKSRSRPGIREKNRQYASWYEKQPKATKQKSAPRSMRSLSEQWYERNSGARKAHEAVHYAVRKGRIPRVSTLQCANCPKPAAEYHHHLGYEPKHWFDVIPMCRSCHNRTHKTKLPVE